jgi:hypothetical protein
MVVMASRLHKNFRHLPLSMRKHNLARLLDLRGEGIFVIVLAGEIGLDGGRIDSVD